MSTDLAATIQKVRAPWAVQRGWGQRRGGAGARAWALVCSGLGARWKELRQLLPVLLCDSCWGARGCRACACRWRARSSTLQTRGSVRRRRAPTARTCRPPPPPRQRQRLMGPAGAGAAALGALQAGRRPRRPMGASRPRQREARRRPRGRAKVCRGRGAAPCITGTPAGWLGMGSACMQRSSLLAAVRTSLRIV